MGHFMFSEGRIIFNDCDLNGFFPLSGMLLTGCFHFLDYTLSN